MKPTHKRAPRQHQHHSKPKHNSKSKQDARPKPEQLETGLTKVFGLHAVTSLLQQRPEQVSHLEVQEGRTDARMQEVLALAAQANITVNHLSRSLLDAQNNGVHQGIIAWAQPRQAGNEKELEDLLSQAENPLLLILDGVTDPHNLGACMRSAEAAGAVAVIVPKDKSSSLNATVRKVACGATETLPLIQVTNLARCLRGLKAYGIHIIGTAGEATDLIYSANLKQPLALVMGAEDKGLRRLTRENCDQLAKLPMAGEVSSLNVSVASGICLFEAVRQRSLG